MNEKTGDYSRRTAAIGQPTRPAAPPPGWEIVSTECVRAERGGTVIIAKGLHDAAHFIEGQDPEPVLVARLVVPGEEPITFTLTSSAVRFVVGRDRATCNAILADPLVSRKHFSIGVDGDAPYIEDHGSTNGTYVDRVRVEGTRALHGGAHIRFGRTEVLFEFD
ncbi:MAG: FHA domain-containing protein [Coriobacteriia bacterium]|nr:FHA domain-containing protein [Coriobacteriia bacterium]